MKVVVNSLAAGVEGVVCYYILYEIGRELVAQGVLTVVSSRLLVFTAIVLWLLSGGLTRVQERATW